MSDERLRLNTITMKNFRLVKSASVKLSGAGLLYLGGANNDIPNANSNMSGKTTLVSAIVWAVTGLNLDGKRAANAVIRHHSRGGASVTLDLRSGKARAALTRTRKGGKEEVSLAVQGQQLIVGTPDNMLPHLEELFGPLEMFIPAHVFTVEEGVRPFALQPDATKKSLFDIIVRSADLEAARMLAQKSLRDVGKELNAMHVTREVKQAELDMMTEAAKTARESLRRDVQRLEGTIYQQGEKRRTAHATEALMKPELDTLRARTPMLHHASAQATHCEKVEKALKVTLDALLAEAPCRAGSVCDACGQVIDAKHATQLNDGRVGKIESATVEHRAAMNATAQLHMSCVTAKGTDERCKKRLAELQTKEHEWVADKAAAAVELRVALNERRAAEDKLAEYDAGVDISELEKALRLLAAKTFKLEWTKQAYEFWRDAFGPKGIKAYRLEKIVPKLNELASKYAHQLFGDGMTVGYTTQTQNKNGKTYREEFSVSLYDANNVPVDVVSAGQAMRRDIIHTLALSELASMLGFRRMDLLVFDEVFRSLDAAGVDGVMNILRRLEESTDTLMVIEHDDELESRFDTVLQAERTNGETVYR